jgi:hypothetical protein
MPRDVYWALQVLIALAGSALLAARLQLPWIWAPFVLLEVWVIALRLKNAGRSVWLALIPIALAVGPFPAGLYAGDFLSPGSGGAALAGGMIGIAVALVGCLASVVALGLLPSERTLAA